MGITKNILTTGGIVTVAGALVIGQMDSKPIELSAMEEIKLAIPGDEIKALRTPTSESYKINNALVNTKVYSEPIHYVDEETGKLEKPDYEVKEISLLAKLNPFKEYDNYVNAGFYSATWLSDTENDYKFTDSKDGYISYKTAYETKGIAVFKEVIRDGIKQSYVMLDESAATALKWQIEASGKLELSEDGSVKVNGSEIVIAAPIAWDSKDTAIAVKVTISGDTLIYEPDLKGAVYPVTIDPTTKLVISSKSLTLRYTSSAWLTARNYAGNAQNISNYRVGTLYAGDYYLYRTFLGFSIPAMAAASACTLYVNGNGSGGGDSLVVISAMSHRTNAGLDNKPYTTFNGWQASGAYTGNILNSNIGYSYSDAWNKFIFNSVGRDSLTAASGDTMWVALLSYKDYQGVTAGAVNNYNDFTSTTDHPYLSMTVQVGASVNVLASADSSTTVYHTHPSTYTGARDTTVAGGNTAFSAGKPIIGQWVSGTDYVVERVQSQFHIPATAATDSLTYAEYWFKLYADSSATNFDIYGIVSTKTGAANNDWFNDFAGWGASGAYTPVYLTELFNTVNLYNGWGKLAFTQAGIDSIKAHASSDINIAVLSSRDIASTAPTNTEYITIDNGADRPYLKLYYTPRVPQNVSVTAIDADSLLVSWTDVTGDETGFRIVNAADSSAVDSVSAGVTSKRIGGLDPNSLHTWKIQVMGGVLDGQCSESDESYTKANIPGAVTITFPADSLLKFVFNVNSNPAHTEFAIQDSITGKYVQKITGLDTLGATEMWGTSAFWGGANGDTVKIYPGKKYTIRVKARSGE